MFVFAVAELFQECGVFGGDDVEHCFEGAILLHDVPDESVKKLATIVADDSTVSVHTTVELMKRVGFSAEILRDENRGFFAGNDRTFDSIGGKCTTESSGIADEKNVVVSNF